MGWGRRFKREGTYVYLWLIHVDVWQKPSQYCSYLPVKNKIHLLKNEFSSTFLICVPNGPVQVRCMILDAWGWCTEMTQRDGMGRDERGEPRMGNTCIPVADSC